MRPCPSCGRPARMHLWASTVRGAHTPSGPPVLASCHSGDGAWDSAPIRPHASALVVSQSDSAPRPPEGPAMLLGLGLRLAERKLRLVTRGKRGSILVVPELSAVLCPCCSDCIRGTCPFLPPNNSRGRHDVGKWGKQSDGPAIGGTRTGTRIWGDHVCELSCSESAVSAGKSCYRGFLLLRLRMGGLGLAHPARRVSSHQWCPFSGWSVVRMLLMLGQHICRRTMGRAGYI